MPKVQININIPKALLRKRNYLQTHPRSDLGQTLGVALLRQLRRLTVMGKKARKQRVIARKKKTQGAPKGKNVLIRDTLEKENSLIQEDTVEHASEPLRVDKVTSLPLCAKDRKFQTVWYACRKCLRVFRTAADRNQHCELHKERRSSRQSKAQVTPKSTREPTPRTSSTRKSVRVASFNETTAEPFADISVNSKPPTADTSTSSTTSVTQHSRLRGTGQLGCDICFRQFSSRKDLKIHLTEHNSAKPEKAIHLGRKTGKMSTLSIQSMDPDDDTPYDDLPLLGKASNIHTCKVCNKSFGLEKSLSRHMKTHLDGSNRTGSPASITSLRRTTRDAARKVDSASKFAKETLESLMRFKKRDRSSPTPMSP